LCRLIKTQHKGHNIENQLIFKASDQFVFHDSVGFEAGSVAETEKVKAFITRRAAAEELSDQLFAIWCVARVPSAKKLNGTHQLNLLSGIASRPTAVDR
jgi:hypothetical protein